MTDRLTRSDWIDHGLHVLASSGHGALKAGPMSLALKVSRGSFYWHFRDVADFRSQLLQGWEERTTEQVILELAGQAEPDRLRHLMRRAFVAKSELERAVRSWAAHDEAVAARVASADRARIVYIAGLLTVAGVQSPRAQHRAAFLYWAYLGQAMVLDPRHASIGELAMDDISKLFEK